MISRKGYYITDHLEKDYDAIVEGFRIGWVHSCLTWIHPTRLCIQERDFTAGPGPTALIHCRPWDRDIRL